MKKTITFISLLLFFFTPLFSDAAPAVVQSITKQVSSTATTTLALPANVTAGNTIIVAIDAFDSTKGIDSIVDNLNAGQYVIATTSINNSNVGSNDSKNYIAAKANSAGGSLTVSVHNTSTLALSTFIVVAEVSGIDSAATLDSVGISAPHPNTQTNTTSTISPATNGDICFGMGANQNGEATYAAPLLWTLDQSTSTVGVGGIGLFHIVFATTTLANYRVNTTSTLSSNAHASVSACYKAAVAASGATNANSLSLSSLGKGLFNVKQAGFAVKGSSLYIKP
jgi:hypothetical protein